MLSLLFQGQIEIFIMLLIAIVMSLSFHEFGHAWTAKKFGDDTAEKMGRLTLNPVAHVDPLGLLMVATIGFGYAKPVPTDPRNFNSPQASLWISAAGPGMNLILAIISINLFAFGQIYQVEFLTSPGPSLFLEYLCYINLLLMLFNLLPIGPLDGHYILPYFLSKNLAHRYIQWNQQYGAFALLSLIALSFLGVPIFSFLISLAQSISRFLILL
ncbi:site-2 protease family protein [Aliikangiella maris]|uniref:Site-2 protease family protein n=2 Tax=Aliikangiella maris TaxID=3162458 RepID=A0ABV3MUR9_9GAMM